MSSQINGTTLLVPIMETTILKLYYANLPSSTLTLIGSPPGVTSFSIFSLSDDGTTMVVVGNNGQLFYTTLPSTTLTLINFPSVEVTSFSNILLSYDGTKLVVVGNNGQLFYTTLPSSTLTLINFPSVDVTSFSTILLSRDSTKPTNLVVVGNNGQLFYTTLPSTTLTLINFPSVEVTSFSTILLSRDGTTIVVLGNNKNFYYTILPSSILTIISYLYNIQNIFKNLLLSDDGIKFIVIIDSVKLNYSSNISLFGLDFLIPRYDTNLIPVPPPPFDPNLILDPNSPLQPVDPNLSLYNTSLINYAKMNGTGTSLVGYSLFLNKLFYIKSITNQIINNNIPSYAADFIPIIFPSGISPSDSYLLNNNGTILVAKGNNNLLYYTTSLSSSQTLTQITLPLNATSFISYSLSDDGMYLVAVDNNNKYYYTTTLATSPELTPLSFSAIATIANICFPAGTPILTDQGIIAIDKINIQVNTIHQKKIVDITKTISKETFLICFEKDALGLDMPSEETRISQNHLIFYEDAFHKAKWFLEKLAGVKEIPYTGELLYNILLEKHYYISVNNLICETLRPDNIFAKLYTKQCKLSQKDRDLMIKVLKVCEDSNNITAYNQIVQYC